MSSKRRKSKSSSKRKPSSKSSSKRKPKKSSQRKSSSKGRSRARVDQQLLKELPEMRTVKVKSAGRRKPRNPDKDPLDVAAIMDRLDNTYFDEIGAFLLIGFGLVSFLTLLSPSSGSIGNQLSAALTTAFGLGAYVVAGVILAAGVMLLLPKIGIVIVPNWWRVITGEIFFIFALGYFHASIRYHIGGEAGQIEAFARAVEGRGGGMVGWALQEAIHSLMGNMTTGAILLGVLVVSGALTAGVRRSHMVKALAWLQAWLVERATRLNPTVVEAPAPVAVTPEPAPAPQPTQAAPVIPKVEINAPAPTPSAESSPEAPAEKVTMPPPSSPLPPPAEPQTIEERIQALREAGEFKERFSLDEISDKKGRRRRPDYLPPLDLLEERDYERPNSDTLNYSAHVIEETVADFGMQVEVVDVKAGPTITQYAVQPFTQVDGEKTTQRVRVTRVASLAQDLSLALSARSVRIQAPVPGTNYIGVEVPNPRPGIVSLRPLLESAAFQRVKSPLAIALGREVDGAPIAADLGKMPHLLIGGTTGSGKSVALRSITTCLVMNNTPQRLRLILIDPKMVELIRFNGIPHLLGKVEVQLDRALGVLRWITREMDRRYKLMEEAQSRNIASYNKGRRRENRLPYIVVVVDELAELMNEFPDQTEHLVTRLAQMARATGIHLIVATQRPSTDVITGLIKANFPARIGFAVASGTDSRVILDSTGAEELIGKGDMLYQSPEAMAPVRLQGCFVSDEEIEGVVTFWEEKWKPDEEKRKKVAPWERALTRAAILSRTDPLLEEAILLVQEEREASASMLQRRLNVGYPRAGRLVDLLAQLGVVGEDPGGGRTRTVLISEEIDVTSYLVDHRYLLD